MSVDPFRGLRRLARRIRGQSPPWAVLLYHRIADLPVDPWSLAVTPHHFAEHLDVLRQQGRPVALATLDEMLRSKTCLDRAFAVTFDDGYADNLHHARPLLEQREIPATVFVTTGYLGNEREYWWDELERVLFQTETLPIILNLRINGNVHQWTVEHRARCDETPTSRWRAWQPPPSDRHALYHDLWQHLHQVSEAERWRVLDRLQIWAGADPEVRRTHRTLTTEELADLARGSLVEIGAHSVTHSALSAMPRSVQWNEIRQSKASLEEALGRPVSSFAYPFGHRRHYTSETVTLVRESGFARACTATGERGRASVDPFQIPRIHVDDCDGEAFARWLTDWLDS